MPRQYVYIEGLPQLQRALTGAGVLAPQAFAASGLVQMEELMTEAKAQTPVDTGTLRDSGQVLPPEIDVNSVEIVAGFGGAASDYAIVQHERLDYNHPTGTSKFLERSFLARAPQMIAAVAAGIGAALKRLGV